jgi:hypothetical protein
MQSIKVVQKAKYLAINCDEITTINNQFWCTLHVYFIDGFRRMLMLLNLEKVINETIFLQLHLIDTKISNGVWGFDS